MLDEALLHTDASALPPEAATATAAGAIPVPVPGATPAPPPVVVVVVVGDNADALRIHAVPKFILTLRF